MNVPEMAIAARLAGNGVDGGVASGCPRAGPQHKNAGYAEALWPGYLSHPMRQL